MSGLAGTLGERATLLARSGRDTLGGGSGWVDGLTLWAAVRPDGVGNGDDAGATRRWAVTLRTSTPAVMAERLRWRGTVLRVRTVESDPAAPDRIVLHMEEIR